MDRIQTSALRRASALLLAAGASFGCASPPWACTPETCVSVATEHLPGELRGEWRADDGSLLRIEDYYVGRVGGEVVPTAATAVWRVPTGESVRAHITSFDGSVAVGEQYLGGETLRRSRSPRRFFRLEVVDGELLVASLRTESLAAHAGEDLAQVVEFEGRPALAYTDVRAMADVVARLVDRSEAWTGEASYTRP